MAVRIEGIKKQTDNPYLNMYVADAVDNVDKHFSYYYASRNEKEENLIANTGELKPEAAIIYGVISKDGEDHLVLVKQFRLPVNMKIYEAPAGLVDKGETVEEAAVREFKEETGLDLEIYRGGAEFFRRAFVQEQGISDECGAIVFGRATGEVSITGLEDSEDIEVVLANKAEVRRILSEEYVPMQGLYLMSMFLNAEERNPFSFLNV